MWKKLRLSGRRGGEESGWRCERYNPHQLAGLWDEGIYDFEFAGYWERELPTVQQALVQLNQAVDHYIFGDYPEPSGGSGYRGTMVGPCPSSVRTEGRSLLYERNNGPIMPSLRLRADDFRN